MSACFIFLHTCRMNYLSLLLLARDVFGKLLFFVIALCLSHHELPVLLSCQTLMCLPGSFLNHTSPFISCMADILWQDSAGNDVHVT